MAALLDYDPTVAAQAFSGLERLFVDLLRAHGIAMPQLNVLVDGLLVDAFWPEANLGGRARWIRVSPDRDAFERDRRKLAHLRLAGREVLLLTHSQVTREPAWVAATVRALLERGRRTALRAKS